MKAVKANALDLGALQLNVEVAANNLLLTQRAKQKADADYARAVDLKEQCDITLNAGIAQLKASTKVPNLYAA